MAPRAARGTCLPLALESLSPSGHYALVARRLGSIIGSLLVLTAVLGACSTHSTPRAAPQPVALANLSSYQALVITKTGTYTMRSPFMDYLGHPAPQLALSPNICNYLSGSVASLDFTLTTTATGTQLETMLASLRVTSVKQPVVVGYQFGYVLDGPSIVSLDGRPGPPCLEHAGSSPPVASPVPSASAEAARNHRDYSSAPSTPSCPVRMPRRPTTGSIVDGLANSLVPFVATSVRVCEYWLDKHGSTSLGSSSSEGGTEAVVADVEDEMNAFATVSPSDQARECPPTSPPLLFVTFYRSSASVDIREASGCGWITNGALAATPTPRWRSEMALWAACEGCRSTIPTMANG